MAKNMFFYLSDGSDESDVAAGHIRSFRIFVVWSFGVIGEIVVIT